MDEFYEPAKPEPHCSIKNWRDELYESAELFGKLRTRESSQESKTPGFSSTSRRSRNRIFVGPPRRLVRHSFSDGGSQAKAGHFVGNFVEAEESSLQTKILCFSYTS